MSTDGAQGVSLVYYVDVLRQRIWVVLLCAALGVALAWGALAVVPATVTATAAVSADVISTDPFNPSRSASGLIDPAGEALVARSFVVADRAAAGLGGDFTAQELRDAAEVSVVADTTVLRISTTAGSEERARAMADALAQEYLAHRSERAQERIDRILARSEEQLDALRADLDAVDQTILTADEGSLELARAETERSLLTLEIDSILSEVASAENIDTTGGVVLNPAATNTVEWFPPRGLVLLTGLLAGLGLGVLAAFLVDALDGRVRTARDVTANGGRRVLGELRGRRTGVPATGADLAELRAARERVLAEPVLADRRGVLAVLDESPTGQGHDVAANLALTLGAAGVRADLVELAHEGAGGGGDRGDGRDRGDRDDTEQVEPLSAAVRHEVAALREGGLVVLAVPHGASTATRLAAGHLADGVVLVAARRRTRSARLARTAQDLRAMGAPVLGTLLVPAHRSGPDRRRAGESGESGETGRVGQSAGTDGADPGTVAGERGEAAVDGPDVPQRGHQPRGLDR